MMQIRRAQQHDLPALVTLAEGYCEADGAAFSRERVAAGFAPLLSENPHGVVLVAESEDSASILRGYAVLTWGWSIEAGGCEALLDEIYVASPGAGIGSALVDAVMDEARAHGAARVFLETESANDAARDFWLRRGFEVEESVWLQRRCI